MPRCRRRSDPAGVVANEPEEGGRRIDGFGEGELGTAGQGAGESKAQRFQWVEFRSKLK